MKKTFSAIACTILTLVMLFSFTACSSLEAEFVGNYKDCTTEEIKTLNTNIQKQEDAVETITEFKNGFKLYGSLSTNSSKQTISASISLTSAIVEDKFQLAAESNISMGDDSSSKTDVSIYYKDGKLSGTGYLFGTEFSYANAPTLDIVARSTISGAISSFDCSNLYESIINAAAEGKFATKNIKIATTSDSIKFKIIIDKSAFIATSDDEGALEAGGETKGEIYLSLNKDYSLRGFKINVESKASLSDEDSKGSVVSNETVSMKYDLTLVPYEGDVEIPSDLKEIVK